MALLALFPLKVGLQMGAKKCELGPSVAREHRARVPDEAKAAATVIYRAAALMGTSARQQQQQRAGRPRQHSRRQNCPRRCSLCTRSCLLWWCRPPHHRCRSEGIKGQRPGRRAAEQDAASPVTRGVAPGEGEPRAGHATAGDVHERTIFASFLWLTVSHGRTARAEHTASSGDSPSCPSRRQTADPPRRPTPSSIACPRSRST